MMRKRLTRCSTDPTIYQEMVTGTFMIYVSILWSQNVDSVEAHNFAIHYSTICRQDLYQYLKNNHPLFGICFRHPLHPVSRSMTFAAFFGSIVFGLAITNMVYLYFVMDNRDFDESYYSATVSDQGITGNENFDKYAVTEVNVTSGMIALWTVGGALNAIYDSMIWSVAACACCRPGGRLEKFERYRKYMPLVVMFVVVGTVALATMAVLIVAAGDSVSKDQKISAELKTGGNANAESFRFLLAFFIELLISLFVWYPIVTTIFFSGVLNCCGKVPYLGGRPQEMRDLEKAEESEGEGLEVVYKK
jgi:hypothetical protein